MLLLPQLPPHLLLLLLLQLLLLLLLMLLPHLLLMLLLPQLLLRLLMLLQPPSPLLPREAVKHQKIRIIMSTNLIVLVTAHSVRIVLI
jgi:hypothetical protein